MSLSRCCPGGGYPLSSTIQARHQPHTLGCKGFFGWGLRALEA